MDLENINLSEISQRKTATVRHHLYVQSKEKKVHAKQKQTHTCRNKPVVTKGGRGGGSRSGDWS